MSNSSFRESCKNSGPPGIVTTASALRRPLPRMPASSTFFGGQLEGRAAIEGAHRNIFDTIYGDSRASFMLRSIRILRPDVAIVFARAH